MTKTVKHAENTFPLAKALHRKVGCAFVSVDIMKSKGDSQMKINGDMVSKALDGVTRKAEAEILKRFVAICKSHTYYPADTYKGRVECKVVDIDDIEMELEKMLEELK